MAHDLPDSVEVQASALDMFHPFGLDISAEASEDRLVQGHEIVSQNRLARRNGDVVPTAHGENAPAHRAVMPRAVTALPAHHRNRDAGEEIGMPRQYPEAAGG